VSLSGPAWRKSTWSHSNGCVEVAFFKDKVVVRDSKNRRGPMLVFSSFEWDAFLGGVLDGEFDFPDEQGLRFAQAG
jgi:Domain of unknown function (DUF397)